MPGRRVRAAVPLIVAALGVAAVAAGVGIARPTARIPSIRAAADGPAVLLDTAHDVHRGDATWVLTGPLTYIRTPGCFVMRGPGPAVVASVEDLDRYPPMRPVLWPAGTRGAVDGERVGVQLPTGETIWAGQWVEAAGTPVRDLGSDRLSRSIAACRSDEFVVLERVRAVPPGPDFLDFGAYQVRGVPPLDTSRPWTSGAGQAVSNDDVAMFSGPEHCNMESLMFLDLTSDGSGAQTYTEYLRDPFGLFADREDVGFDAATRLPANAVSTGYSHDEVTLRVTSTAAYLVFADRVERWPRLSSPIGCL